MLIIQDTKSVMMDFVLNELTRILNSIVVKLDYIAERYETEKSMQESDTYCNAYLKFDSFFSYSKYSEYALNKCGFTQNEILEYMEDRTKIPIDRRDEALLYQREYIINTYVEENDYYRELNGLPRLADTDFVYVTGSVSGVDTTKPVHLMNRDEIVILNVTGILRNLIASNPTKKYLKHLSDAKIPIHVSRRATNFNILYIPKSMNDPALTGVFVRLYSETLDYVLKTIYSKAYKMNSDYYDAFIGLFMVCITAQRFIANYFSSGIARDFYDKELIKLLFDSYGLPFYSNISLVYLRRVAKNLNKLLMYKSTDKVFVDIFELFDMENIEIYKYFLLKDHKKDAMGNPVMKYKKVSASDLDPTLFEYVPVVEEMYELKFVQVPRSTKNISADLSEPSNYLDYALVTGEDALWGGGDDTDQTAFKRKILSSEFNFIETKYLAVTSKYELTKVNFEVCYLFRMLVDTVEAQDYMELDIMYVNGKVKLFDAIIALFALLCKKLHFDGNIMDTTTKVMSVYGFNFNTNFEYIKNIIKTHRLKEDPNFNEDSVTLKDFPALFMDSKEFVTLYDENRSVHDTILESKYKCKKLREFNAYKKMYDAMMVTDYVTDMYRSPDGTLPATYLEYLRLHNVSLYSLVDSTNEDNMIESLDAILISLENYFKTDKFNNVFLNIPSLSAENLRRFIYYLIDIFKSYTVDLTAMNIMYHVDSKTMHNLKLIFEDHPTVDVEEYEKFNYKDAFTSIITNLEIYKELKLKFKPHVYNYFDRFDKIKILSGEKVDFFSKFLELWDNVGIDFFDYIDTALYNEMKTKLKIDPKEYYRENVINNSLKLALTEATEFFAPSVNTYKQKLKIYSIYDVSTTSILMDKLIRMMFDKWVDTLDIEHSLKLILKTNIDSYFSYDKGFSLDISYCSDLLHDGVVNTEHKDKIRIKENLFMIRKD